ncbi:MAG: hypothetical protein KGL39_51950 [Patescibacteria group bacterium]|nr:hypothetical protein [Patescibacteria group bacterium]
MTRPMTPSLARERKMTALESDLRNALDRSVEERGAFLEAVTQLVADVARAASRALADEEEQVEGVKAP